MKKFAIIMGQGYDGAGVTSAVKEMMSWGQKNGYEITTYIYDNQTYAPKVSEFEYQFFTYKDIDEITKQINENFDVVMFHSYALKSFSKESILGFTKLVKALKPIKIGFDHSATKTVMNTIPHLVVIANEMDLLYSFGLDGTFGTSISKLLKSKRLGDRIKELRLWFDFDKYKENWNVPFNKRNKRLVYIGRFAGYKNTDKVLDIGKLLKDSSLKVEMHGIGGSIAAKVNIFDSPYVIRKGKVDKHGELGCIEVYGPYVHNEMMKYLSESMFGISLFFTSPRDSARMEYAQAEIIANGAIPIFDKEWGENFIARNGKPYIEQEKSAIYIDRNNITANDIAWILNVMDSEEIAEAYRKNSLEAAKREFDINIVLKQIFDEMLSVTRDTEKYLSEEDLILGISNNKSFVDMYGHYKDELVILNPSQLQRNNLCLLENKRQKFIKHFK